MERKKELVTKILQIMATAGFITMFMKSAEHPANPEKMKPLIKHFNDNGGTYYNYSTLACLILHPKSQSNILLYTFISYICIVLT